MLKLDLKGADLVLRKIVAVVSVLLVRRGFVALDGHSHQIALHLGTYLLDLKAYEARVVDECVLFEGGFAERDVDALSVSLEEKALF